MPLTEALPYFGRRFVCVFREHDMAAIVRWSPDVTCLHFVCSRCGKELGHLDLPTNPHRKKESVH
jgi:hypothetical protein